MSARDRIIEACQSLFEINNDLSEVNIAKVCVIAKCSASTATPIVREFKQQKRGARSQQLPTKAHELSQQLYDALIESANDFVDGELKDIREKNRVLVEQAKNKDEQINSLRLEIEASINHNRRVEKLCADYQAASEDDRRLLNAERANTSFLRDRESELTKLLKVERDQTDKMRQLLSENELVAGNYKSALATTKELLELLKARYEKLEAEHKEQQETILNLETKLLRRPLTPRSRINESKKGQ